TERAEAEMPEAEPRDHLRQRPGEEQQPVRRIEQAVLRVAEHRKAEALMRVPKRQLTARDRIAHEPTRWIHEAHDIAVVDHASDKQWPIEDRERCEQYERARAPRRNDRAKHAAILQHFADRAL